ncbi:MAG: hypothetical protein PHW53_03990 [Patescibacteria group bacterium]|nr:hypothetical protein [Patescibacteria group bacterium]
MTKNAKIYAVIAIVAVLGAGYGVYHLLGNNAPRGAETTDMASITNFDQCVEAGFAIMKSYPEQCMTSDGRIFVNQNPPAESELNKAEEAIRTFMGEPNLELQYTGQNNHLSNFAVLSNVKQNDGGFTADNPEEWDRPIYIFQQKDFINDRCEIYEYEVSTKTYQVIQVGIRYPQERSAVMPGNCPGNGSLDWPLMSKDEIEQAAFSYLGHDPEHTKFLIRSDIQPQYISSKPDAKNPAANEWRWEDKSYKLPDGLMGDPWPYPTMRIIMSAGGKLVYYLNTTDLFKN